MESKQALSDVKQSSSGVELMEVKGGRGGGHNRDNSSHVRFSLNESQSVNIDDDSDSASDSGASMISIKTGADGGDDDRMQYAFMDEDQLWSTDPVSTDVVSNDVNNLKRWATNNSAAEQQNLADRQRMYGATKADGVDSHESLRKFRKVAKASNKPWVRALGRFFLHPWFQWFTGILTIWALVAIDIQALVFPMSWDYWASFVLFVILVVFSVEIIGLSVVEEGYFLGFFFWCDVLATVSLVPDILLFFGHDNESFASLAIARSGRVARAVGRTARFSRLMKAFAVFKDSEADDQLSWVDSNDDGSITRAQQATQAAVKKLARRTKVGKALSDAQFQKLFVMLLGVFVVFSFLAPTNSPSPGQFAEVSLSNLQLLDTASSPQLAASLAHYQSQHADTLVSLYLSGNAMVTDKTEDYRTSELFEVTCQGVPTSGTCKSVFSIRSIEVDNAIRSLAITALVVVALLATSHALARDTETLIIEPLERMLSTLRLLARNPLAPLALKGSFRYEVEFLESMLSKMAILIQIGLGAAGQNLIRRNLSSSGSMVPLVAGEREEAIFFCCTLPDFDRICDGMEERVLVLLNLFAQLVHTRLVAAGGYPYSNHQGSISAVFPLPSREKHGDHWMHRAQSVARKAIKACSAAYKSVASNMELRTMAKEVGLSYVQVRFALHSGWAVRGAVGSSLKVDCTYVSPTVNICDTLPKACLDHGYGVTILLTEQVYQIMDHESQENCLKLDVVSLTGLREPVALYCADWDPFQSKAGDSNELVYRFQRGEYKQAYLNGLEKYLQGEWPEAKEFLEKARDIAPKARPPEHLLACMRATNFEPPADFQGYGLLPVTAKSQPLPTGLTEEDFTAGAVAVLQSHASLLGSPKAELVRDISGMMHAVHFTRATSTDAVSAADSDDE